MINLIVAISKNNIIGKNNSLPWYYPEDLKYFKKITTGKTVVMGRKTFESIINRNNIPLPNRVNVVLTRDSGYKFDGAIIINDLNKFLDNNKDEDIFIIGGKQIFDESMHYVDRFYITHIDKDYDGDTSLSIDYSKLNLVSKISEGDLTFAVYERLR